MRSWVGGWSAGGVDWAAVRRYGTATDTSTFLEHHISTPKFSKKNILLCAFLEGLFNGNLLLMQCYTGSHL